MTLVFGIMHIVNFAHAAVYMLGAYIVYYLFAIWQQDYIIAFIAAVVLTGVCGVLIERFFYRPVRLVLLSTIIVAVGVNMAMEHGALLAFGAAPKGVPSIFTGVVNAFGITLPVERLAVAGIGLALILAILFFIRYTKPGRAMRAVYEDADAARLAGVNVSFTYSLCMGIGCALAGASGALMSSIYNVNPFMGMPFLFKAFIIIIVGGLGSIPGSILAGLLIGLVDSIFLTWLGNIAHIFGFIIVILILLFRPRGLLGHA